MKKMKFWIPAVAFAALAFVGCSDDDASEGQSGAGATRLALADAAQAELTFAAEAPEAQIVKLDTDASAVTVAQVLGEGETAAEWCEVSVLSATEIKVAPASNFDSEARSIKYRVSAGALAPVEFVVKQEGAGTPPQQDELSIPEEYKFVAGSGDFEQIAIPVTTTAEKWTATLTSMMGDDEEFCPYCQIYPEEGASGEEVTITFYPNTTGEMQSGWVIELTAGNADAIQIYVTQNVPEAKDYATSVVVSREGDEESEWEPVPVASPYTADFSAAGGYSERQTFYIEAEGKFDIKVVEADTETELDEAAAAWLLQGAESGASWPIVVAKNETGAERKLDLIITGAEGVVLFRMHVVQAGA